MCYPIEDNGGIISMEHTFTVSGDLNMMSDDYTCDCGLITKADIKGLDTEMGV